MEPNWETSIKQPDFPKLGRSQRERAARVRPQAFPSADSAVSPARLTGKPGDSPRHIGSRNQSPRARRNRPPGVWRAGAGPRFAIPPDLPRMVSDPGLGYVCRDFVRKFPRR